MFKHQSITTKLLVQIILVLVALGLTTLEPAYEGFQSNGMTYFSIIFSELLCGCYILQLIV